MYVLISDVARWITVVLAAWLTFMLLRLIYLRVRHLTTRAPEPASMWGTVLLLSLVIARRFDRLGQPGDFYLWIALAACLLLLRGVLKAYSVPFATRRGDTTRGRRAG